MLKSKFRSSIEKLKRFLNFGGWRLVPAHGSLNATQSYTSDRFIDENSSFDESVSLMASHHSLTPTKTVLISAPQPKYQLQQQGHGQQSFAMARNVYQLIDDEVPLIKF